MRHKDLAAALGISDSMVSRLVKRGMPADTVERADRWRRRHLEPARTKGMRADSMPPPLPVAPRAIERWTSVDDLRTEPPPDHIEPGTDAWVAFSNERLARAQRLMEVAELAYRAGRLDLVKEDLQLAMRGVPPSARHQLMVAVDVMDALTASVMAVLRADAVPSDDSATAQDSALADSVAYMETFWYGVAAGEIELRPNDVP